MTAPARIALAALALGLAAPASAQDPACRPAPAETIPVFETAKAAMLAGDYDAFYEIATPYVSNPEEKKVSLIGPLERLMPDGFASCWNVVQRHEPPGLYQEVTFFDTGSGPLGLYLLGTVYRGEIAIMHFAYSDTPADMLDKLK